MTPEMDYGALRFVLDLVQLVGIVLVGVYSWLSNARKANTQWLEELDTDVRRLDNRASVIESQMQQAPTHYDLSQIYERVNQLSNAIERMTGEVTGISHQMRLISDHLLNRERKEKGSE